MALKNRNFTKNLFCLFVFSSVRHQCLVEMPDGIYTTIDNARVVSAREAGINVEANVHGYNDPLPSEYIERFTTKKGVPKTWGEAIELRVGKQKSIF